MTKLVPRTAFFGALIMLGSTAAASEAPQASTIFENATLPTLTLVDGETRAMVNTEKRSFVTPVARRGYNRGGYRYVRPYRRPYYRTYYQPLYRPYYGRYYRYRYYGPGPRNYFYYGRPGISIRFSF